MDEDAAVVQAAETPRAKKRKKGRVETTTIKTGEQDCNSDANLDRGDDLSSLPNVSKKKKTRTAKKMSSSIVSDINGISDIGLGLPDFSSNVNDDPNPEIHESKITSSRKKKTISNPDRCIQEGSGHAIITELHDSNSGIRPTTDPDQSNVDHIRHKEKGKKKNRNNNKSFLDDVDGYAFADSHVTLDLDQSNIEHQRHKKSRKRKHNNSTCMSLLDYVDGNTFDHSSISLDLDKSNIEHPRLKEGKKRKLDRCTTFLDFVDSNTSADSLFSSTQVSGASKQSSSKKRSRSITADISEGTPCTTDIQNNLSQHDSSSLVHESGITGESEMATKKKSKTADIPKNVKAITALVNQSVSDRQLGENIQEVAHERMEDLISICDESFKMLSELTIVLPYKEHPSRKFETTMLKPTSADVKQQIASTGLEMKTGKFNLEEDKIIKENWNDFARNYGVSNPQYFVRFRNNNKISGLPPKERRNFVRYLAKGLEHRYLQCIYMRFRHLFKTKPESGKFSEEEDKVILNYLSLDIKNPYHMIALVLKRDRLAVYRRCKLLQTLAEVDVKDTTNIHWDLEKKAELIKSLLKATKSKHVKNLRGMHITGDVWTQVANDVGTRSRKVEHVWNQRLYTQLFAKEPLFTNKMCIKILELLRTSKTMFWQDVNWNDMAKHFNGVNGLFLWSKFKSLVQQKVPNKKWKNLSKCVGDLHKRWLPTVNLDKEIEYQRLSYVNGQLIARP